MEELSGGPAPMEQEVKLKTEGSFVLTIADLKAEVCL